MPVAANDEHPVRTRRSGYRYVFTAKHHGGTKGAATWLPTISRDDEFSIFDSADLHDIGDDRGWLYGVLPNEEATLRALGTRGELVAEFQPGDWWHGYPRWPLLSRKAAGNRKRAPARAVFDKLLAAGLITAVQQRQLVKGKHP